MTTAATMRPMRGLWRDRHPSDVPAGALQRAENVVFRKRGVLSPIEAPALYSNADLYPLAGNVSDVLSFNRLLDLGEYTLAVYREGNADVGDLARTDSATIATGNHYHHGRWIVDGRVTLAGRVILITEAIDVEDGEDYTIETGSHYHYDRWIIDDRVTVNGRVILILDRTEWLWSPDGTRFPAALPTEPISYEAGCMNATRYRDRVYWTSRQGLICSDPVVHISDEHQTPAAARRAGLPAPLFDTVSTASTSDNSGGFASGDLTDCCAVFKRTLDDGSFLRSPPSTPVRVLNIGVNPLILVHTVSWSAGIELAAGDEVEIYRTEAASPGSEDYRLACSVVLTAADITNRYVAISDASNDDGLGGSLYTNAGEEGAISAHFPPPYLRDVVEQGGALLGIIAREHESITTTLAGRWGTLSTVADRTYGWGVRSITGDITTGLKTITNVSAAHMTGIVAGQIIQQTNRFPRGTVVTAATGTTITASNPATATGAGLGFEVYDVLKINDTTLTGGSVYGLLAKDDNGYTTMFDVPGITMRISAPVQPSVTLDDHIQVSWSRHYAYGDARPFYVGATNADNFNPPLGSLTAPTASKSYPHGNRIAYSAGDLPESWPLLSRQFIGSADLVRMLKVGDAVYTFADNGTVYRISGTVGDYRVDPVWHGYRLLSAPAAASNGDAGYFWSSRGWCRITDGGLDVISKDRVETVLRNETTKLTPMSGEWVAHPETPFNWFASCAIDPVNAEAWLRARVIGGDGLTFIYSESEQEVTEYPLIHGLGCVGYSKGAIGGGVLVSGLDSPIVYALSQRITGLYEGSFCIELQRVDLGTPGALKLLNEIVLGITTEGGQGDDVSINVTVQGDMDQGDGSADTVAVALSGAPQRLGRHHVVPVGRKSAQASEYTVRIESDGADHKLQWFLEHVALRFEPAADGTGART
jgi:hypothetical protein